MAKKIMIQGTMSSAGKSLIVAGLCRIFKQDGYKVAPFKSQNMALNSFITEDGLEMGRAQVMQAEAAGILPEVEMNPILLKPTSDKGSQIIINGKVMTDMDAKEYFKYKTNLIPVIKDAFAKLEEKYDIIVIEGAGSPAEINLKQNDIVNMGVAKMFDSNVLLVGDIDRGGVFAQLLGTLMLLEEDENERIKGLIINKFRGDKTILDPGIDMLVEKGGKPVCGTVPYMNVRLDDEDSLTERFRKEDNSPDVIDIAVIRLPKISNFTDFDVFDSVKGCKIRYIDTAAELKNPDMIIIPGSKNTVEDLLWLRESGLEAAIKYASVRIPVFGICGGLQMLGETVSDETGVDSGGKVLGSVRGMELLPIDTVMKDEKTRKQVRGNIPELTGIFEGLSGKKYTGYEIHMGESIIRRGDERSVNENCSNVNTGDCNQAGDNAAKYDFPVIVQSGNIYGTYVHGIFDDSDIASSLVRIIAEERGIKDIEESNITYKEYKEMQYDILADKLRESLDMEYIYSVLK